MRGLMRDRLLLAVLTGLLIITSVAGLAYRAGRSTPGKYASVEASTARAAYDALASSGTRGAVLVSIDDESPIVPELRLYDRVGGFGSIEQSASAFDYDLVAALVESGVVRQVYQVVPDAAWADLQQRLSSAPATIDEGRVYRRRLYGAPIHYTRAADLKLPADKVVVVAERAVARQFDPQFVEWLTGERIASLVVWKENVNE